MSTPAGTTWRPSVTYDTVARVAGPLLFVERVRGVGFRELVDIETPDGAHRRGEVVEVEGEVAVVQWGCGTSCQVARFANVKSGFVYSDWVNTSSGVEFRPNSRLFITNPPGTQCAEPCNHATCEQPRYFFWDKGALFEIQPPETK